MSSSSHRNWVGFRRSLCVFREEMPLAWTLKPSTKKGNSVSGLRGALCLGPRKGQAGEVLPQFISKRFLSRWQLWDPVCCTQISSWEQDRSWPDYWHGDTLENLIWWSLQQYLSKHCLAHSVYKGLLHWCWHKVLKTNNSRHTMGTFLGFCIGRGSEDASPCVSISWALFAGRALSRCAL